MRPFAWLLLAFPALAADVCEPSGDEWKGGRPGVLDWRSVHNRIGSNKNCVVNELRRAAPAPLEVQWKDAGLARASVAGRLEIAACCFEDATAAEAALRFGTSGEELMAKAFKGSHGAGRKEKEFPDFLKRGARERSIGIRGTLWDGEREAPVDLVLRCSATKFADRFAYQFRIADNSPEPLDVEWSLLREAGAKMSPMVQPVPKGNVWIFLSQAEPRYAAGVVEIRTRSGRSLARLEFEGFAASEAK